MKKTFYLLLSSLILLSGACKKDITSLNTNPKQPTSVPPGPVFLLGEKSLFDTYTSTDVGQAPFRVLAQEWTENTYVYEAQYNFAAYQAPDGWWDDLYGVARTVNNTATSVSVINNLETAKRSFRATVLDPAILKNDLIITDMLEVYAYYFLVATYGDIPYSQAENSKIPFPKYDNQKTVYKDLLTRIDSCVKDINPSTTAMGVADQVYMGNVTQWKKFGATLKLKIAMLNADNDPATTATKVQEALASGVFQSDADDALLNYDSSLPSNSNPIYQALVYSGRHDFAPTNILVDTLKYLKDPRLPLYVTQFDTSRHTYTGAIPGAGNGYGLFSDFSPAIQAATYPGDILDYVECQFLLAEAAARGFAVPGTAASYYNSAVTASIVFWGGSSTSAATYLAQPAVAYTTAGTDWRKVIGLQEWLADYNKNWDAWTVIRRLGNPNVDVLNRPVAAQGGFPIRFTYPTTEKTSNSVNWAAGVADLAGGKDVVTAKLFWVK